MDMLNEKALVLSTFDTLAANPSYPGRVLAYVLNANLRKAGVTFADVEVPAAGGTTKTQNRALALNALVEEGTLKVALHKGGATFYRPDRLPAAGEQAQGEKVRRVTLATQRAAARKDGAAFGEAIAAMIRAGASNEAIGIFTRDYAARVTK